MEAQLRLGAHGVEEEHQRTLSPFFDDPGDKADYQNNNGFVLI